MRRSFSLVALMGSLVPFVDALLPTAQAYSPPTPTLAVALRWRFASQALPQGTTADIAVYQMVNGQWSRNPVWSGTRRAGFNLPVPANGAYLVRTCLAPPLSGRGS